MKKKSKKEASPEVCAVQTGNANKAFSLLDSVMPGMQDMHLYSGKDSVPGFCHMTRGGNFFRGSIIGQGDVPVKQCIRIMKRAGYDGYLCIEFEGKEDCILGIEQGYATLKRYIAEVEAE